MSQVSYFSPIEYQDGAEEHFSALKLVIDALVKAKYLFKLKNANRHGYYTPSKRKSFL